MKAADRVKTQEDLIRFGRTDLVAFSRWPLGLRGEYELWNCQKEWQTIVQEMYLEKLRDSNSKNLCILAPSEHGKTTSIAIPFVLWALARNRNLRILIVGSKDDLAANVGYGIDRHFANSSENLAKFGLLAGWPWNQNEKFVQRDNDNIIHPSILCVGPETEIQGKRADIIIMTDVATFKNQRNAELRAKLVDFVDHTLLPRLEPWGFVLVEGHHVNHEDFYTELESRDEEWKVVKYKSILEEPSEASNGKAKLLAPEQWTYEQLRRIRSRRPAVFQLIYQNVPIETKGLVNREILEKGLDRSRPLVHTATDEVRMGYASLEMMVDPAFSIKKWSKFSCALLFGITREGRQDLLAGWRLRLLPNQLRSKIAQSVAMWRPNNVFIEANAAQIFLVDEVRKVLGPKSGIVRPVYTLGGNPEDTVEQAVSDCVNLIETGQATFPYQGPEAQELTEQLFTEIVNFPSGRFTDVMMAWVIGQNGMKRIDEMARRTIRFHGIASSVSRMRRFGRGLQIPMQASIPFVPPL